MNEWIENELKKKKEYWRLKVKERGHKKVKSYKGPQFFLQNIWAKATWQGSLV